MAVRAVFFDFVGTLAFVDPDVGTVYATTARTFGLDLDPTAVRRAFAEVFPRRPPLAFPRDLPGDVRRTAEFAWWRAVVADTLRACGVPTGGATGGFLHPASRSGHPTPNTEFDFEAYFAALYETFAAPAVWRLYPDARTVLKTLRQKGLRTGVVWGAVFSSSGFSLASWAIFSKASIKASNSSFETVSVGSIIIASGTINGK